MGPNAAQQVIAVLQYLAHALSPLARQVWGIYVRQQVVYAINDLITQAFWIIVSVTALVIVGRWVGRYLRYREKGNPDAFEDQGTAVAVVSGIVGTLAIIALLVALTSIGPDVARLLNPQYYALQELIHALKP